MSQVLYDTIIIGSGPAGAAAAVYAARKKLKTLLILTEFGGQSRISASIANWIGEVKLTGQELAKKLQDHVEAQEDVEVLQPARVTEVTQRQGCAFEVKTAEGGFYRSKTIIAASGRHRQHLEVPGEERLEGKGVAYCSTCDAPFFQDQDVAVVGSGNAAMEMVIDLASYASKIYLIIRSEQPKGDPAVLEKVNKIQQLQIINRAEVREILGDRAVKGLRYKEIETGKTRELEVAGVFVAIGSLPNSDFVRNLVDTNQAGEIVVDHKTAQTSKRGIFAAGDVTDDPFKQNNIAAGDGVRAALSAYYHILSIQKYSPCAENEA